MRPVEPGGQGLIGEGGPNDGREDFMQVGEPLDGIGEGLLVDLGVFGPDAVADDAVVDGGEVRDPSDYSKKPLMMFDYRGRKLRPSDHRTFVYKCFHAAYFEQHALYGLAIRLWPN